MSCVGFSLSKPPGPEAPACAHSLAAFGLHRGQAMRQTTLLGCVPRTRTPPARIGRIFAGAHSGPSQRINGRARAHRRRRRRRTLMKNIRLVWPSTHDCRLAAICNSQPHTRKRCIMAGWVAERAACVCKACARACVRACTERKMYWKMNLFVIVFTPSSVRQHRSAQPAGSCTVERRTYNIQPLNAMANEQRKK